jgi:hypothetical protein
MRRLPRASQSRTSIIWKPRRGADRAAPGRMPEIWCSLRSRGVGDKVVDRLKAEFA